MPKLINSLFAFIQIARIAVSLNETQEELEKAIKSNDFHQAAALKDQVAELQQKKSELEEEINKKKDNELQRVEKVCMHFYSDIINVKNFV